MQVVQWGLNSHGETCGLMNIAVKIILGLNVYCSITADALKLDYITKT